MRPRQEHVFEEFAREFIRRHQRPRPLWPVERILVATDLSLCSLTALEYAEELARRFDAELLLLHADEVPLTGSEMAGVTHAVAERELARTIQQLRDDDLKARSLLRPGAPAEEILRAAETRAASLIVMGIHGRKGVAHMPMGSVAERVVRSAPCPVLTVGRRKDG
jgi:nucleotide-binding universal stress UspA family protein